MELNVARSEGDYRAEYLSLGFSSPFEVDGVRVVSVRSLMAGILFPVYDTRHFTTFLLSGYAAKREEEKALQEFGRKSVWWRHRQIAYGSASHFSLISRAIRAKVDQKRMVKFALLQTAGFRLVYDQGDVEPECAPLPVEDFLRILTEIREDLHDPGLANAS